MEVKITKIDLEKHINYLIDKYYISHKHLKNHKHYPNFENTDVFIRNFEGFRIYNKNTVIFFDNFTLAKIVYKITDDFDLTFDNIEKEFLKRKPQLDKIKNIL